MVTAFVVGGFGRLPSDSPYYQQEPMPEPIILWAVISSDPNYGWLAGYHDMVYAIRDELIQIGIDLRIRTMPEGEIWDTCWDARWNVPGDADGDPTTYTSGVDGWDITTTDWSLEPNGYQWFPSTFYSWATPEAGGYNIGDWNNTLAEYFADKAMTSLDPAEHKQWMWLWQGQYMHDPPQIPVFYGDLGVATTSWLDGYDFMTMYYASIQDLGINVTKFNEVAPPARKAIGNDTIIVGAYGNVYTWNGMICLSDTESTVSHFRLENLFATTREHMTPWPPSGKQVLRPLLAADVLEWRDGPYGPNTVARLPVRQNVTWSDGVPFNASDVAFTMNVNIDPASGGWVMNDFPGLESAEVFDEYTVDFIFKEPKYGFESSLSNSFGLVMLPWHQLKDVAVRDIKSHPTNSDPVPVSRGGEGLEGTGPYVVVSYDPGVEIIFEKRKDYWKDAELKHDEYWGPAYGIGERLPENVILKFIPDEGDRLIALQTSQIDYGEYMVADLATLEIMATYPTHRVWTSPYVASHGIWLNLNNPILSNRYVRLAIAHAIPYDFIRNQIAPGWGFNQTYPGKTATVTPGMYAFNTELGNYVYDIDIANKYMDMWRNSQLSKPYLLGPAGDADFSGFVEMADYPIWADNFGTNHTEWIFLAGQDIDPDHNNDDLVQMADFFDGWEFKSKYWYPEDAEFPAWYHW